MMLFAWPALWTIAGLLWWYSPTQSGVRWAALTAFCAGCGAMSVVIGDVVLPFLHGSSDMGTGRTLMCWRWIEVFTSIVSQWGLPFVFLQFAIRYTTKLSTLRLRIVTWASATPIFLMFLLTPITPPISYNFLFNLTWAGPYLAIAITLLLLKEWKESNGAMRSNRRFTNLISIPPITFHLVTNYVFRAVHIENVWYWNGAIIWLVFGGFIWLLIRRGIFGIRLHAEQQRHDWSWKAVRTSTSILHHALKNELNKINWLLGKQTTDPLSYQNEMQQSIEHLHVVLNRLHRQTADIDMREELIDVPTFVARFLNDQHTKAESKGVAIELFGGPDVSLCADEFHVKESLRNVWNNALESIQRAEGRIQISWELHRGDFVLMVKDNGCGIPETEVRDIFQPYFSTKSTSENYGFGLFYVYEVMKRHQGWIDVTSKIDVGTTMKFVFPRKRVQIMKNKEGARQ